MLDDNNLINIV